MGLPVLNFKFLPDRCHWRRNSERLPPEKEGVAKARPPLFKTATCFSSWSDTGLSGGTAPYSLQSPDATSLSSQGLFTHHRRGSERLRNMPKHLDQRVRTLLSF